jgi:NAD(P)-dependent dehydrogenase (short-subunit alcohol dehydrogenase family)
MPAKPDARFTGKVAAITGAGSGIGRALALELAHRGCHVAISDVNEDALQPVAEACRAAGVEASATRVDTADREAVHTWADDTAARHGRVNFIFNNAGVALGATINGTTYEDFEWLMGVNFWGVVHGTKAFLPHLMAARDGHVINVSSVFGLMGIPTQGAYNASKFAVRGFTDCLRQELEIMNCGVSATCVHPGGIKTNIARAARKHDSVRELGLPEDDGSDFEKNFRTTPEQAANVILRAVAKNRRRVMIGTDSYFFDWIARLFPGHYQGLLVAVVRMQARRNK